MPEIQGRKFRGRNDLSENLGELFRVLEPFPDSAEALCDSAEALCDSVEALFISVEALPSKGVCQ